MDSESDGEHWIFVKHLELCEDPPDPGGDTRFMSGLYARDFAWLREMYSRVRLFASGNVDVGAFHARDDMSGAVRPERADVSHCPSPRSLEDIYRRFRSMYDEGPFLRPDSVVSEADLGGGFAAVVRMNRIHEDRSGRTQTATVKSDGDRTFLSWPSDEPPLRFLGDARLDGDLGEPVVYGFDSESVETDAEGYPSSVFRRRTVRMRVPDNVYWNGKGDVWSGYRRLFGNGSVAGLRVRGVDVLHTGGHETGFFRPAAFFGSVPSVRWEVDAGDSTDADGNLLDPDGFLGAAGRLGGLSPLALVRGVPRVSESDSDSSFGRGGLDVYPSVRDDERNFWADENLDDSAFFSQGSDTGDFDAVRRAYMVPPFAMPFLTGIPYPDPGDGSDAFEWEPWWTPNRVPAVPFPQLGFFEFGSAVHGQTVDFLAKALPWFSRTVIPVECVVADVSMSATCDGSSSLHGRSETKDLDAEGQVIAVHKGRQDYTGSFSQTATLSGRFVVELGCADPRLFPFLVGRDLLDRSRVGLSCSAGTGSPGSGKSVSGYKLTERASGGDVEHAKDVTGNVAVNWTASLKLSRIRPVFPSAAARKFARVSARTAGSCRYSDVHSVTDSQDETISDSDSWDISDSESYGSESGLEYFLPKRMLPFVRKATLYAWVRTELRSGGPDSREYDEKGTGDGWETDDVRRTRSSVRYGMRLVRLGDVGSDGEVDGVVDPVSFLPVDGGVRSSPPFSVPSGFVPHGMTLGADVTESWSGGPRHRTEDNPVGVLSTTSVPRAFLVVEWDFSDLLYDPYDSGEG